MKSDFIYLSPRNVENPRILQLLLLKIANVKNYILNYKVLYIHYTKNIRNNFKIAARKKVIWLIKKSIFIACWIKTL